MKNIPLRLAVPIVVSLIAVALARQPAHAAGVWHGFAAPDNPNVRSGSSVGSPVVATLQPGQPVEVMAWVQGDRVTGVNATWAELAPGQYVYSSGLRKPDPSAPPPPAQTFSGHWIDANLTEQVLTAYDGTTPLFWAVMSSGAPGTDTETGVHRILRRVANETMSSATLRFSVAIPYYLTNVLYTQYFTDYGAAIHDNWWKNDTSPFGVPTSHGCLGIREADALKFWNFAGVGTIVNIHD